MNATRVWLNMQKQGYSKGLGVYKQVMVGRRSFKEKLQQQEQKYLVPLDGKYRDVLTGRNWIALSATL